LRQDLLHVLFHMLVDYPIATSEVAIFGCFADEFMHLVETAFVDQIDNQLQLVQALEVSNVGLIAGIDQSFESGKNQLAGATAQDCLLSKKIGFCFFLEGGLQHSSPGAADGMGIGKSSLEGFA